MPVATALPAAAPRPRPLPLIVPAVLLPIATSLIVHAQLGAATTPPYMNLSLLPQHVQSQLVTLLPPTAFPALEASVGFSLLAFVMALFIIPAMGPAFIEKGLKGRDMLKGVAGGILPETMGLPCACIYIMLLMMFIPFPFHSHFDISGNADGGKHKPFPHQELTLYLSAILSLLTATLLGLLDDIFDIRWRHKIPIPLVASIPLLLVYYAESGLTEVVIPKGFRGLLGTRVDLGPLYYLYMSLLSTFSTNSINILAGINGIEVSQSLIIAMSVALNDSLYLPIWPRVAFGQPGMPNEWVVLEGGAILSRGSKELVQRHLLSLYFMGPLIGVCTALLYHNWYPARVFVGDTFCYFTGMAFAVVAIQGHFSKTLLLFFMPQIFNFVLSCPQLFGLVECPRHRMPKLDEKTGLLLPSRVHFTRPPPLRTVLVIRLLETLRLVDVEEDDDTNAIKSATNLTLPTVILLVLGPLREPTLTKVVMGLQVGGSALAFTIRYGLAGLLYDGDRR